MPNQPKSKEEAEQLLRQLGDRISARQAALSKMPFKPLKSDNEQLFDTLQQHHDGTFGYVVYRVVYGDDERWARFMQRLDAHAQAAFDGPRKYPVTDELKAAFNFDVREDEAQLKGASKSEVRRVFNEWVRSVLGSCNLTRYTACIYADEEIITSVLNGEEPGDDDPRLTDHSKTFVKLIHVLDSESFPQISAKDIPDDEVRNRLNSGDDGYPPLEGCRLRDVGWMKSAVQWLANPTYLYMGNGGWNYLYRRPPKVQN